MGAAMTRHPLRFVSDEERQTYRKWIRNLALGYGTIIVFAIGLTALRVEQRVNDASAKALTGTVLVSNLDRR